MFCPRCGKPNPPQAAFCMTCGAPIAAPPPQPVAHVPVAPPPSIQADYEMSRKRTVITLTVAGVLGLAVLAFLGLRAAGILRFGASTPDEKNLQARGQAPDDTLLKAKGQTLPRPVFERAAQAPVRKEMPADVRAWLEHLERTEKAREELSIDQLSAAMVSFTKLQITGGADALQSLLDEASTGEEAPPPTRGVQMDTEGMRARWVELTQRFRSVPPPTECVPIRDAYDRALGETSGMMGDVLGAIERAEQDPQGAVAALTKMKGKSTVVDDAARSTDGLVADICARYDTKKWFTIKSDYGGGTLGKGGF